MASFFSACMLDPVAVLSKVHEETCEVVGRVQVEEKAVSPRSYDYTTNYSEVLDQGIKLPCGMATL